MSDEQVFVVMIPAGLRMSWILCVGLGELIKLTFLTVRRRRRSLTRAMMDSIDLTSACLIYRPSL